MVSPFSTSRNSSPKRVFASYAPTVFISATPDRLVAD
jgi:hypothetical protein